MNWLRTLSPALDLSLNTVFLVLIGVTGALICFGLSQLVLEAFGGRRKLQQRLSDSNWKSQVTSAYKAVKIRKTEEKHRGALAELSALDRFERGLLQVYPGSTLARFLAMTVAVACAAFATSASITGKMPLSIAIGLFCGMLPFLVVNSRRARRRNLLDDQLPEALEFLSRILRAGHSLATGMGMISEELPNPIAAEFRQVYDQHSLGQPLEESLKDLEMRVESPDFAFFVTAVLIQRQTGGDLAEVLDNISNMVRSRIRLQQHVRAITAEGRFTGYILAAFPIVLFLITYSVNSKYASVLLTTSEGRSLLIGAVILQILGLLLIRKIVAVKL